MSDLQTILGLAIIMAGVIYAAYRVGVLDERRKRDRDRMLWRRLKSAGWDVR